jgi:hypothetical protein
MPHNPLAGLDTAKVAGLFALGAIAVLVGCAKGFASVRISG